MFTKLRETFKYSYDYNYIIEVLNVKPTQGSVKISFLVIKQSKIRFKC